MESGAAGHGRSDEFAFVIVEELCPVVGAAAGMPALMVVAISNQSSVESGARLHAVAVPGWLPGPVGIVLLGW